MGDFLRIILDSFKYLWPFRIVEQFEVGVYYVLGRRIKVPAWYGGPDCRPGRLWVVVPFFTDLKTIAVKRTTLVTPKQTITCLDGRSLTFSASAQVEVGDANLAYNEVDQWAETTAEDIAAILSERLATAPPAELEPESRARMIGNCRRAITAQVSTYGVTLVSLRFNNFIRGARVVQLFHEQSWTKDGG